MFIRDETKEPQVYKNNSNAPYVLETEEVHETFKRAAIICKMMAKKFLEGRQKGNNVEEMREKSVFTMLTRLIERYLIV
jgi:hypothetical protein